MVHVPALIQFLKGLSENNNKAWFVMNRPSYDILRAEFITLVAEVIAQSARFDPRLATLDAKKAMFRINRDVRFAHDKSPYKTIFSAALSADGKKSQGPMYYFQIDGEGELFTAAGCYMPEKELLAKIRTHIAVHPQMLSALLRNQDFAATGGFSREAELVRPPKGYDADMPHVDIVRLKSFTIQSSMDISKRAPKDLAGTIAARFKTMFPLVKWLRQAL